MICRVLLLSLAALTLLPLLWRYCFNHQDEVSLATRNRLTTDSEREEQIREQVEMPRGRRRVEDSRPTPRTALTREVPR